jgi:hypothetical protein
MWAYAGLLREESTLREGLAAQAACAKAWPKLRAGKGREAAAWPKRRP